MTLTEFLLARIAEDEVEYRSEFYYGYLDVRDKLLAECKVKREAVLLHPEMLGWCQGCAHQTYPCRTLLALASVYADHPDYREEWRV